MFGRPGHSTTHRFTFRATVSNQSRRPGKLPGSQAQSVVLALAFATNPRVLLLDEPLFALDHTLCVDMQIELIRIQHEIAVTYVAHDQDEGLTLDQKTCQSKLNDRAERMWVTCWRGGTEYSPGGLSGGLSDSGFRFSLSDTPQQLCLERLDSRKACRFHTLGIPDKTDTGTLPPLRQQQPTCPVQRGFAKVSEEFATISFDLSHCNCQTLGRTARSCPTRQEDAGCQAQWNYLSRDLAWCNTGRHA